MNTNEKVIVSVSEGKVRGFKNRSEFSGAEFYSFLGVPYGESTAGYARFKDPVAVKPWKSILNATTAKGGCFQFSLREKSLSGSEDCLYNNIHTPQLPQKNDEQLLKPVIVLMHPGACLIGSPDPSNYGSPEFVMQNDIVYVCVAFRLHIFGFLNLDLKECSGNQGLKDIILSLQWIRKNIINFGGDPNNITLLGSSSGGQIVHHLMLSPRSKGLFHKAVIMGLYKYCPSIIMPDHNSWIAFEIAKSLGYNGTNDNKKLLSFFKKIDPVRLVLIRQDRFFSERKGYAHFYPCAPFVATFDIGENPAIPPFDKKKELETMARIPLMIGFCEREPVMGFLPPYKKACTENYYKSVRQNCWGWGRNLSDDQIELLRNRVESHYLNGKPIENASLQLKCDIQMDMALSDVYTSLIDVVAADCPSSVYAYKFQFEGNAITMKNLFKFVFDEPINGTFHGDDYSHWNYFEYHQDIVKAKHPLTPKTEEMIKTFTKMISTFAKTENPNYDGISTQWDPTTVENPRYLSINDDLQMVDGKLNGDHMEYWENLIKEFETRNQASVTTGSNDSQ